MEDYNQCERIRFFKIRVCLKEHLRSLHLTSRPFIRRLKKQVSAACKQLPARIPVYKCNRLHFRRVNPASSMAFVSA